MPLGWWIRTSSKSWACSSSNPGAASLSGWQGTAPAKVTIWIMPWGFGRADSASWTGRTAEFVPYGINSAPARHFDGYSHAMLKQETVCPSPLTMWQASGQIEPCEWSSTLPTPHSGRLTELSVLPPDEPFMLPNQGPYQTELPIRFCLTGMSCVHVSASFAIRFMRCSMRNPEPLSDPLLLYLGVGMTCHMCDQSIEQRRLGQPAAYVPRRGCCGGGYFSVSSLSW